MTSVLVQLQPSEAWCNVPISKKQEIYDVRHICRQMVTVASACTVYIEQWGNEKSSCVWVLIERNKQRNKLGET